MWHESLSLYEHHPWWLSGVCLDSCLGWLADYLAYLILLVLETHPIKLYASSHVQTQDED